MTLQLSPTVAPSNDLQTPLIRYPRFNELHREIQRCQTLSRTAGEPQCMALEGVPGAGKVNPFVYQSDQRFASPRGEG